MRLRFLALPALTFAALLASSDDARACGGCFPPVQQSGSTVVTGHRMALAVSTKQTVLWDQIQYTGDPDDFAWVLPVKPGAVIEVSTDAWFETLDAATTAQVLSPVLNCSSAPRTPGGCSVLSAGGFGSADEFGEEPGGDVTVVHQGTVGPYETVTLKTDVPGALDDWLLAHDYNIDADVEPIIDAYVAEGFEFLALRLAPGQGVREMKPVRVVTPGGSAALPLRMVAAGTGASVAITLFTITEGRLAVDAYDNRVIDGRLLAWDFAAQQSNYGELRKQVLASNAGFTWITAFAQRGALLSQIQSSSQGPIGFGFDEEFGDYVSTIADSYMNQGVKNGEIPAICPGISAEIQEIAGASAMVASSCPLGVPFGDPSCGEVADSDIDANRLACGALDDLARAFVGLHPKDVWLTRLEADLPRLALKSDITLSPAASQTSVDNWMQATIALNTENVCPERAPIQSGVPLFGGKGGEGPRGGDRSTPVFLAVIGLAFLGALGRRIARRVTTG